MSVMVAWELVAVLLSALFVIVPLSLGAENGRSINISDWFSGLTLVVLVVQAWIFERQAKIMKQQAILLSSQEKLVSKQTDSMLKQTDSIQKQATLAHQGYLQLNRPKIRIRNIVINPQSWAQPFKTGQFYVENYGGTNALIIESYCCLVNIFGNLPMMRPYEGHPTGYEINNPIGCNTIVEAGRSVVGIFSVDLKILDETMASTANAQRKIFFMGWIDYTDDNKTLRRFAFCRERVDRHGSTRFEAVNDPDYEHEG